MSKVIWKNILILFNSKCKFIFSNAWNGKYDKKTDYYGELKELLLVNKNLEEKAFNKQNNLIIPNKEEILLDQNLMDLKQDAVIDNNEEEYDINDFPGKIK